MAEGNGRTVTVRELNDKLALVDEKLKRAVWEQRAYFLIMILGVLLKFQVPENAAGLIARLF